MVIIRKKPHVLQAPLPLFLAIVALNVNAQTLIGEGYMSIAEKGGMNGEQISIHLDGLYLGWSWDLPVMGDISFRPGLYYTFAMKMVSGSYEISGVNAWYNGRLAEHVMQVPLVLEYRKQITNTRRLFICMGPTLIGGLSAGTDLEIKTRSFGSVGQYVDKYRDENLRRFNFMLGAGFGVDINHVRLGIYLDRTPLKCYASSVANEKVMRTYLRFGVAILVPNGIFDGVFDGVFE